MYDSYTFCSSKKNKPKTTDFCMMEQAALKYCFQVTGLEKYIIPAELSILLHNVFPH